jgi:hypothetical protein
MAIDRVTHPGAYDRGSPKQRLAAIELYGTMILMKHIVSHSTVMAFTLPMVTDNMGYAYAVTSWKSKLWPNSLLLLELALTNHRHKIRTDLKHRPDSFEWYVLTKFKEFHKINEPP